MMSRGFGVCLLLLMASPLAAAEVRLRTSAVAGGAVVRLADVADITSQDPALCEALGEIPLCPAPSAGRERALHQYEIRQLLTVSGVEPGRATVTGSEAVRVAFQPSDQPVARIKRPLAAAGVRQAAFAASVEPGTETGAKKSAKSSTEPGSTESGNTESGNKAETNRQPPPPAPSRQDAKGAVLVERGAAVTVQARVAGVRITTSGKALDEGGAGATIGVELADTKQRVLAQVTGPQSVEVTAN